MTDEMRKAAGTLVHLPLYHHGSLMRVLEELDSALVLFGRFARAECAQIFSPPGFRIQFSRIEAVPSGLKFSNHAAQKSRYCAQKLEGREIAPWPA